MSNHHESELRQMGTQIFITRHSTQRPTELLLVQDVSKSEISAGLLHGFTPANEDRWHVFAGGRQIDPETNQGETVGGTARREWREEIEELNGEISPLVATAVLSLPEINDQHQQIYPFVVGQRVQEEKHGQLRTVALNEVTATTTYFDFDGLPRELQTELDQTVKRGRAEWHTFAQLTHAFVSAQITERALVGDKLVRPWLLTGAMIYHWQHASGYEPERIIHKIQSWNVLAYRYLLRHAQQAGVELNNGNMGTNGLLLPDLPAEDYRYLGVRNKQPVGQGS